MPPAPRDHRFACASLFFFINRLREFESGGQPAACSGTGVAVSGVRGEKIMTIRTQLKAGRLAGNHNEALKVRSTLKAGGVSLNHNEAMARASERPLISMRRQPRTTTRREDRLELLVVRAGLRAGRRAAWACARGRNR